MNRSASPTKGVSGSVLVRPASERLRDLAAGGIDRLYALSPDRLARGLAHQALLVDDFRRDGVELISLDHAHDPTPEGNLLHQIQGVIAEREREKYMRTQSPENVAGGPLGIGPRVRPGPLRLSLHRSPGGGRGGAARFEIADDQAEVIRRVFTWVVDKVARRPRSAAAWKIKGRQPERAASLAHILANPTYAGTAMFGRTRLGRPRPELRRSRRLKDGQIRKSESICRAEASEQVAIAVPEIVEPEVFEAAWVQLDEDRERKRVGDVAISAHKPLNRGRLDAAAWGDVRSSLLDPTRLSAEHRRRLEGPAEPTDPKATSATKKVDAVHWSLARLIDSC